MHEVQHRPTVDFVLYLDDDSIVSLTKLMRKIEQNNDPLLAMGYVMNTVLDHSQDDICDMCDCNKKAMCREDPTLHEWCGILKDHGAPSDLKLGGCLHYLNVCRSYGFQQDMTHEYDAIAPFRCAMKAIKAENDLMDYFGNREPPPWFLGMGWVWGRKIVDFISRNVDYLKLNGAADVSTGYWMAAIEGVKWVDMGVDINMFHDYPEYHSQFSSRCDNSSILIHRMSPERWAGFNPNSCNLHCLPVVPSAPEHDPSANPYPDFPTGPISLVSLE